jgi:two-component system chemotaxis sensor kinase CheA
MGEGMDDDGLLQGFFEESAEQLADFEECLLRLETTPEDQELLNKSFRAIHTIKGNSGMLGFDRIARVAHAVEDLLGRLRKHEVPMTRPVADLLLRSADVIKRLFGEARGEQGDEAGGEQLIEELKAFLERAKPAERVYAIRLKLKPDPMALQPGIDLLQLFEEIRRAATVEAIEVEQTGAPRSGELDPQQCFLEWRVRVRSRLEPSALAKLFGFVGEDGIVEISAASPAPPASTITRSSEVPLIGELLLEEGAVTPTQLDEALRKHKKVGEILVEAGAISPEHVERALEKQAHLQEKQEASTIRVSTEKVDKLVNLVGELVIAQSMISQTVAASGTERIHLLEGAVGQMERNLRELQERVMAVRMLPIRTVFGRFPRLVRDLAQQCGKEIAIQVRGEETELDKTVIEQISDPLTHLVRNAVDHGIEAPEVREHLSKPRQGVVSLNAFHQGGSVFIQIHDDGQGLDRERILRKGIEQGLVEEGAVLTDERIYDLILKPGFSTAERVTEVSGRGVGMDVVRRNIEALGGQVLVETKPGSGCSFTIKLPLTLAILDGLSVEVGAELYIIPLLTIVESIRPKPSQVHTITGQGEVVDVRGRPLPILRLHVLLGVTPRVTDPTQGLLVIVENGGEKVAFLVDELLGQHQVVIKSLETHYRRVEGVAGATIMGDGRVALILDVPGLVRLAEGRRELLVAV